MSAATNMIIISATLRRTTLMCKSFAQSATLNAIARKHRKRIASMGTSTRPKTPAIKQTGLDFAENADVRATEIGAVMRLIGEIIAAIGRLAVGKTTIEWTDFSFNPWVGCTKVSPGCDHCYAEGWAKRTKDGAALWQGERRRTTAENWRKPLKWNKQAEAEGRRYRVFCASLADVFDNQVSWEWRKDLWLLIKETPHLDWLLLTKRPQNIAKMLPHGWGNGWHNVWLGASTENREEMLRRGRALKTIPAAVHFWSAEPLLEDLGIIPADIMPSWIIAGGESGPGARPMHPDWARSLRDQCAEAGVPFFFKQWGDWFPECQWEHNPYLPLPTSKGIWHIEQLPLHAVGKARAGRLLDGVEHNEFPPAQT